MKKISRINLLFLFLLSFSISVLSSLEQHRKKIENPWILSQNNEAEASSKQLFFDLIQKHNCTFPIQDDKGNPPISFATFVRNEKETLRGVVATSKIEKGQVFFQSKSLISLETIFRSKDLGALLLDQYRSKKLDETQVFAAWLSHSSFHGTDPEFSLYFSSLPSKSEQLSLMSFLASTKNETAVVSVNQERMNSLDLDPISKTAAFAKIRQAKERILSLQKFCQDLQLSQHEQWCTVDQLLDSMFLLESRRFSLELEHAQMDALIPVADFCNHEPGMVHWFFSEDTRQFSMLALRDIEPGEQIFLNYGAQQGAFRQLLSFGFVTHQSPNDFVQLFVNPAIYFDPNLPLEVRRDLMRQISPENARLLRNSSPFSLVQDAKFIVATEKDLAIPANIHSARIEKKALRFILTLAEQRLKEYSTTIEQDFELYDSEEDNNTIVKNAILFRIGQKEILQHNIERLKVAIDELSSQGDVPLSSAAYARIFGLFGLEKLESELSEAEAAGSKERVSILSKRFANDVAQIVKRSISFNDLDSLQILNSLFASRRKEVIKKVLDFNVDLVNYLNPLVSAIVQDSPELVLKLLEMGANPNVFLFDSVPAYYATSHSSSESQKRIAKYLDKFGVDKTVEPPEKFKKMFEKKMKGSTADSFPSFDKSPSLIVIISIGVLLTVLAFVFVSKRFKKRNEKKKQKKK